MAQLDKKGFNIDTRPNLFKNPTYGTEYKQVERVVKAPTKTIEPARDSRYSSYAAPMSDGRLVTDYRPHCYKNIPPYAQYNSKLWMVQHAEYIINESRKRQSEWTGANLPLANTVPPPADIVHSTPFYSEVMTTNVPSGIGIERANSSAPDLFGTYSYQPSFSELRNNRKNISNTTKYEGGRNSVRGMY